MRSTKLSIRAVAVLATSALVAGFGVLGSTSALAEDTLDGVPAVVQPEEVAAPEAVEEVAPEAVDEVPPAEAPVVEPVIEDAVVAAEAPAEEAAPVDEEVAAEAEPIEPIADSGEAADADAEPIMLAPMAVPSDISFTKQGLFDDANGDGWASIGEAIGYTFEVTNNSAQTVYTVAISDPKIGLTGWQCAVFLDAGQTAPCPSPNDYVLTEVDLTAGSVTNTATVSVLPGVEGEPLTVTADDVVVLPAAPEPVADFVVSKYGELVDANDNGYADAGETINYFIQVYNNGDVPLYGVAVSDAMLGINGELCGVDGSLPAGSSDFCGGASDIAYTVTEADVADGRGILNTVDAVAFFADDADNPLESFDYFWVPTAGASLVLDKLAYLIDENGNELADPGEVIEYSFIITNVGAQPLTGVGFVDETLEIEGLCADSMAAGEVVFCEPVIEYVVTVEDVASGGPIVNVAYASGWVPELEEAVFSDYAEALVDVGPYAAIEIDKWAILTDSNDNDKADAGEKIEYHFTIYNAGNLLLEDVGFVDAKFHVDVTCVDELAPGEFVDCAKTIEYIVTAEDVDAGKPIRNAATAFGWAPDLDAQITSEEDLLEIPIGPKPVKKADPPKPVVLPKTGSDSVNTLPALALSMMALVGLALNRRARI